MLLPALLRVRHALVLGVVPGLAHSAPNSSAHACSQRRQASAHTRQCSCIWACVSHSAAHDAPEDLYALWSDAVARSRAAVAEALADGGLDRRVVVMLDESDEPLSLRRLLVDVVEEYARHCGHADLLRECVDGRTGQ